jgi:3-hydroxybutyryl-CoA dehydrogenase
MQIEANNYPVAVLGAGTMGEGIAQIAASAGHSVMLYDVSQQQLETALENIAKRLERSVKKEKITAERFKSAKNSWRTCTGETGD